MKLSALKHIAQGWGKTMGLLKISEAERELSNKRLAVCVECEFAKESKVLEVINNSMEKVDVIYCTACSCPCNQKSLTNDLCKKGFWDNIK